MRADRAEERADRAERAERMEHAIVVWRLPDRADIIHIRTRHTRQAKRESLNELINQTLALRSRGAWPLVREHRWVLLVVDR